MIIVVTIIHIVVALGLILVVLLQQGKGAEIGAVFALRVFDDGSGPALYAAGEFTHAGGTTVNRIARWNGEQWTPMGDGMNDQVNALTVYDNELIAGGRFTEVDGQSINYVARFDGQSWHSVSEDEPDDWVLALSSHEGKLMLGGEFGNVGTQTVNRIASWSIGMPSVTEHPQTVLIEEGAEVVFSVAATSNSPLSYVWRRDGVPLADGGNISGANTPTLTISNATLDDFGAYNALVINDCGVAHSDPAALGVMTKGPDPACPADLNADGVVDGSDLLQLLSQWGDCE
jgi:hypothetical protein